MFLIFLECIFLLSLQPYSCKKSVSGFTKVGNLKLSPIGCGTWAWGNRFLWGYQEEDDIELRKAFKYITSNGVNWFDTADSYGTGSLSGRSEKLLGIFLNETQLKVRPNIYMCTKLAPYPWRIGPSSMINACLSSKERLGRSLDMLQLHWPPSLGWQEKEYLSAFSYAIKEKLANQIGVSNYGPQGLSRVSKVLESNGNKLYSNQVQFSLLSRYPLTNGLVDICIDKNIQLIGYSSLGLGLLTDAYTIDKLPTGPRAILFREYLPVIKPLLDTLRDIAKYRKKTVSQVAINWTLSKGALALVGIRSVAQVRATQDNHRYHLISLLTTSRDTLCYVYRGLHFLRDHQHHLDQ